jgi:AbrB family looped-hinge helix DNA binding protein
MKSAVSEKGQITIPKKLRDRLGIKPGVVLEFREDHGRLVASKVRAANPTDRFYGILKLRRRTDELIRRVRGKADTV